MFSEKSKTIADACRFCWMCRHICPVGLVTGKESNTPRGRALLISMDKRNIPLTLDSTESMYQCCLCEACTNDCATGYDPTVFTRDARTNAYVNEMLPAHIQKNIEAAFNGALNGKAADEKLLNAIAALPATADVALYLGQCARTDGAESALAVMELLKKANVRFTAMADEVDCGAYLGDLIGYVEDVRVIAQAAIAKLEKLGAKTVVVLDPSYAYFLKHQCGEWNLVPAGMEFVTVTSYVAGLISEGKLRPGKAVLNEVVALQDSNRLTRGLDEVEAPRAILAAMGITVKELFLNGKMAKSCGDAVLAQNYGYIVKEMCKARWYEVENAHATMLVTVCPAEYANLAAVRPEDKKLSDLFVLLAGACK